MELSVDAVYLRRLDALDRTWQVWAELGAGLTEAQWPTATRSGGVVTLVEALRIIVLESTVHLLDAQRALGHSPAVPAPALQDTVSVLAELAPPVELIEAATGRSATSPWPVLR